MGNTACYESVLHQFFQYSCVHESAHISKIGDIARSDFGEQSAYDLP